MRAAPSESRCYRSTRRWRSSWWSRCALPDPYPADFPLPAPELVERARAFARAGTPAAAARPAATVVLLRDGPAGLEVFLMRRVATLAFAPGSHVFPGGSVEPGDLEPDADADRALVRAAVRETREETGVLLSPDVLRPWAHWVTPAFEPRRYDTRFFVAPAPAGQLAAVGDGESDDAAWVTPEQALAAQRAGRWLLLPPTELTLRELAPFGQVAQVLAAAQSRLVERWQPAVDLEADPPCFVLVAGP